MRLRTVILVLLGLAIVGLAVGVWWLYASRDVLIKRAIEHFGPDLTGVSVKVKAVKFEPAEGSGAITGLEVGNPPGFSTPRALTLGEIRLAVDPGTLTSDVVRIKELTIDSPSITYERGAKGDNLTTIQRHIESRLPKSKGGEGSKSSDAPQRKFIVDRVVVKNGKVNYGGKLTVEMPDIQLRDLGKKSNGATSAELVDEVWTQMTRSAVSRAPAAIENLRDRLKGLVK